MNLDAYQVNELIFCHKCNILNVSFLQNFEKARFSKIFQNELFEKLSEPSRAELFDQKLEPKSELSEPSLGSGATLISIFQQALSFINLFIRVWSIF